MELGRDVGPGASTSPCVSHLPVPRVFLLPRQLDEEQGNCLEPQGQGVESEGGRTEVDGVADGVPVGSEAVLRSWLYLCLRVRCCLLAVPVPSPPAGAASVPQAGLGTRAVGSCASVKTDISSGPPRAGASRAGGCGWREWGGSRDLTRQFGWAGEMGEGSKAPFAAEWGSQVFFAGKKTDYVSDLEKVARSWDTGHQGRPEQAADARSRGRTESIQRERGT